MSDITEFCECCPNGSLTAQKESNKIIYQKESLGSLSYHDSNGKENIKKALG